MKKIYLISILILSVGFLFSFKSSSEFDLNASIVRGKDVYVGNCISCHMEQGEGLEGVFPPLAASDYLMADKDRSIIQVIKGVSGEMTVNGKLYNGEMVASGLTDTEVSDVLNYIRNSFGNKGVAVLPEHVKAIRNKN